MPVAAPVLMPAPAPVAVPVPASVTVPAPTSVAGIPPMPANAIVLPVQDGRRDIFWMGKYLSIGHWHQRFHLQLVHQCACRMHAHGSGLGRP
ncbi:uncharacterized protein ARMOST_15525 [Armillaria ostoyae]|uniref:Uncharacterized protein n=1 Tax=Armillaria ostoyae TaxID=47428 RepID=A0A284RTN1_ARMOS|nr:uncharacterized protein ARMOST_15525 [Armillaria ostoyae]